MCFSLAAYGIVRDIASPAAHRGGDAPAAFSKKGVRSSGWRLRQVVAPAFNFGTTLAIFERQPAQEAP